MERKKNDRTLNMKLPDDLYERIAEEANKKNISIASIVRLAMTEYLEDKEKWD